MSEGFESKSRTDIVDDMKSRARNLFGQNVNLAENSPLGILIQLFSWPSYLLWEALKKVYNAGYINTATGQDLDNLCKNIGISRMTESKATGAIKFVGDDMVSIPEGTKVETAKDKPIVFETTERVIIDDGSVEAEIIALEGGTSGNLPADTLTELTNPISGVDEVTNPDPTDGGIDKETDTELRERYKDSLDMPGGSTIHSIRANILENTEATACLMLQNVEKEENEEGLPGKSFEAVILGGENQKVAESIFEKAPAGIESYGDESESVTDDSGNTHTIRFSRPEQIDIYCSIKLDTNDNYPDDGDEQIIDEVVDYIGGIDTGDDSHRGLSINEDVIRTKIISLMYNIDGVEDVIEVELGLEEGNLSSGNITIGAREVARTKSDFIEVV